MNNTKKKQALAVLAALVAIPAAAVEFEHSGFASIVAGRTYGACMPDNGLASDFAASCTRFVADWGHAGVYDEKVSLKPESKVGLQGTAKFSPQFSATVQGVARFLEHPTAELEWAYLTWTPAPDWTVQVGRKRLPLFYYSDFQDVGYAYPWVRVPPDVYGWDVVNYNGANVAWSKAFGSWTVRSSVFGGAEHSRRNRYMKLYFDEGKDIRWSRIAGADLEAGNDWITARVVYMRASYQEIDRATGELDLQPSGEGRGDHKAYGGSINIDRDNWIVRTEYSIFDRSQYAYKAISWFASGGYRIGKLTPMVSVSQYHETTRFPDAYEVSRWATKSATLRYELGASSALKLQVDRIRDRRPYFLGDATLVSASYDLVF